MCCILRGAQNRWLTDVYMSKKLYQRSAKQADKVFYITEIVAALSLVFVWFFTAGETRELVAGIILAIFLYHGLRRFLKGPPIGVAIVELAGDMLIFRNPSSVPPKVDRIAVDNIHSIRLMGEKQLRYFDCKLMNGDLAHLGPFERGQGELVTADWFKDALPELSFLVDPSATVMPGSEGLERPREL